MAPNPAANWIDPTDLRAGDARKLSALLDASKELISKLTTLIERAAVVCKDEAEGARHVQASSKSTESLGGATLSELLASFEKDTLRKALKAAYGNRAKAARLLGTTERIFNYRVRKYGIDWQRFKP